MAGWLSGPLKRVSRGRRARYRPRGRTACGRGGSCVHSGARGPKGLAGVKAQPWTRTGVESATVGSEQRRASDSISSTSSKHPFGGSLGSCQGGSRARGGGVRILDALPLGAGANRMRWRGGGGKREERMTQANVPGEKAFPSAELELQGDPSSAMHQARCQVPAEAGAGSVFFHPREDDQGGRYDWVIFN